MTKTKFMKNNIAVTKDRVELAERKLAGLCQICGLDRPKIYKPSSCGFCYHDGPDMNWMDLLDECQDKINAGVVGVFPYNGNQES